MANCNNSCSTAVRLSIDGNSVSGATVCGDGNLNCGGNNSAIECCDTAIIGPRKKRDNVRAKLHDYIVLRLGGPVIELELDEQQIDLAIDEAFDVWEQYAPREFYQYYTFHTVSGKSVYTMPPEVGYIRQVYYKETANLPFNSTGLDGTIPIDYFMGSSTLNGFINPSQPIFGKMGEYTLYQQYLQSFSTMSSAIGGWEFVGGLNNIKLYPIPCGRIPVIVHYLQKCKDWECNYQSIREGALYHAMIILGEIRSKFTNIPGPNGGIVLNGQDILNRGLAGVEKWEERLISRYGDILSIIVG